jgi:hypothetical protein
MKQKKPFGTQKKATHVIHYAQDILYYGVCLLLLGFGLSLLAYYTHVSSLYFFSSFFLSLAIILFFFTMISDIRKESQTWIPSILFVLATLLLYSYQRLHFHHFDLFIADASDYYLAGINEVIHGEDLGFFLPLTASISAVGFSLFGYEYGAIVMIIVYSISIPLLYLLLKEIKLSTWLSLGLTVLFISLPLDIWFSKSMFSEPLWQIEILTLILLSVKILAHKEIKTSLLFALYLLMIVTPFTRGEASLFYGVIFFLGLYHYWLYQELKLALLLILSALILALSIHYTLGLRPTYLLNWQYSRLIANITVGKLMTLLYGVFILMGGSLILLSKIKTHFSAFRLPLWITLFLLFLKIAIAYLYSIKKASIAHLLFFTHGLGFSHFLLLDELSFALDSFGLPLTILIVMGLILLYIEAMKGNILSLILIGIYTLFAIPFVMQVLHALDVHEIFLYWGRYYFSMHMVIHLFALALVFQYTQKILKKYLSASYASYLPLALLALIIGVSVPYKVYHIATTESYLSNSQKLIPWIKEHTHNDSLSVVYDETIRYELHHNRNYNAKELTYRSFPMAGIKPLSYQQAHPNTLNHTLTLNPKMKKAKYLLCLAQKPCELDSNQFTILSSIALPISWREHYGIHPIDKKIHQDVLSQSVTHTLHLYATLYTIQEKFNYAEEILLSHDSALSNQLLSKGWYMPTDKQGAWSRENHTQITLAHIHKEKNTHYRITLKYFIFNASKQHPKTMTISLDGQVLKKLTATKSMMRTLTFGLPNTLLAKQKKVILDIYMSDDTQQKEETRKGMYLQSITLSK